MKLLPSFDPLLSCPLCGSIVEEVGKTRIYPDDTRTWEPTPVEKRCKPDAPGAEKREVVGPAGTDKAGNPTPGKRSVYFVVPYTHLCTRHKEFGDKRPECGMLPRHVLRPYSGEVPASCYYPEGGSHDVSAAVSAMRERAR